MILWAILPTFRDLELAEPGPDDAITLHTADDHCDYDILWALLDVDRALPGIGALELAENIVDGMLIRNNVNGLL